MSSEGGDRVGWALCRAARRAIRGGATRAEIAIEARDGYVEIRWEDDGAPPRNSAADAALDEARWVRANARAMGWSPYTRGPQTLEVAVWARTTQDTTWTRAWSESEGSPGPAPQGEAPASTGTRMGVTAGPGPSEREIARKAQALAAGWPFETQVTTSRGRESEARSARATLAQARAAGATLEVREGAGVGPRAGEPLWMQGWPIEVGLPQAWDVEERWQWAVHAAAEPTLGERLTQETHDDAVPEALEGVVLAAQALLWRTLEAGSATRTHTLKQRTIEAAHAHGHTLSRGPLRLAQWSARDTNAPSEPVDSPERDLLVEDTCSNGHEGDIAELARALESEGTRLYVRGAHSDGREERLEKLEQVRVQIRHEGAWTSAQTFEETYSEQAQEVWAEDPQRAVRVEYATRDAQGRQRWRIAQGEVATSAGESLTEPLALIAPQASIGTEELAEILWARTWNDAKDEGESAGPHWVACVERAGEVCETRLGRVRETVRAAVREMVLGWVPNDIDIAVRITGDTVTVHARAGER